VFEFIFNMSYLETKTSQTDYIIMFFIVFGNKTLISVIEVIENNLF